jgi:outer membrane protein assembly factor BamA
MDLSCDANELTDDSFVPRPAGGTRVLEGNLELRFRLGRTFEGVVFGDVGQVWGAAETVSLADLEFSPGLGVRYLSPVGPIRVDVAYRFRAATDLPVIVSRIVEADPGECTVPSRVCFAYGDTFFVPSGELGILSPFVLYGDTGSRFQLHFSIGQAF